MTLSLKSAFEKAGEPLVMLGGVAIAAVAIAADLVTLPFRSKKSPLFITRLMNPFA